MKRWVRRSAVGVAALAGAAVAGVAVATLLWHRATDRLVTRVTAPPPESAAEVYSRDQLAGLPAPVARYFEFALTPGQPLVRTARIEHEGEFRGSLDAAWSPFRSVQHFSADPAGFVWDAEIRMAPLVGVRVRDHYHAGDAGMTGRVAALLPVVDAHGTPELAAGALHRYFAECAWLPTALLPGRGVRWEAIDDSTARATLVDAGIEVSMEVHFGERGEIERVEMLRYRDVDGEGVLTPFVGRFRDYRPVEGMMIPFAGEVEWILPEGRLDYWRGRVVEARYEWMP